MSRFTISRNDDECAASDRRFNFPEHLSAATAQEPTLNPEKTMERTDIPKLAEGAVAPAAPCSRKVEWQRATLNLSDSVAGSLPMWQLRIDGRVALNAAAVSPIHEAVSAEDRKLIANGILTVSEPALSREQVRDMGRQLWHALTDDLCRLRNNSPEAFAKALERIFFANNTVMAPGSAMPDSESTNPA